MHHYHTGYLKWVHEPGIKHVSFYNQQILIQHQTLLYQKMQKAL